MKISIIGGTGSMGFGLGLRLALAGHIVVIGSRSADKALAAAKKANELTNTNHISGATNKEAAEDCDLAIIAILSGGHKATVAELKDPLAKVPVLDITVPMAFKPLRYAPPEAGSNAMETQQILGENAMVCAGFHTISATLLADIGQKLHCETLIAGNNEALKKQIIQLSLEIGIGAFDAGPLENAAILESLTPLLVGMNKRYGSKHMGIQFTGVSP